MRIALATCKQMPEVDPDEALLVSALLSRGADVRLVAWDDERADVSGDLCVIRSTWNYYHAIDAFLDWCARTASIATLWNPLPIVRWNTNKRYLGDLARRGIPTVPTIYLANPNPNPNPNPRSVADAMRALATDRAVVKPTISAASFETMRVDSTHVEAAEAHARAIAARCEVMVQPYVESVEGYGERSIVFIDGAFTHAIRKSPRFGGEQESVSEALPIAADERALAEAALATLGALPAGAGDELLYARIDLARDAAGRPMIMELELVEPSLFLAQSEEALTRFANAIVDRRDRCEKPGRGA